MNNINLMSDVTGSGGTKFVREMLHITLKFPEFENPGSLDLEESDMNLI